MIFTSIEFVYFFITVFTVFFLLPDRFRIDFLLLASYFFYGFWSVKYLGLLIFTMGLDYWIALKISDAKSEKERKTYLVFSIIINLGILFLFKYFNLFSGVVAALLHQAPFTLDLILPFGISFYTFHAMSYTIDVYRRTIPAERSFRLYSSYVMFFPQLVAGPIARASHLLHQFDTPKRLRLENIVQGSYLVAKGFFYKVVIADALGGFVDASFNSQVFNSPFLHLQSVYFFAFQIYLDFCGYTLIARGVAKWLDFDLVENFDRPYFATSITDFWRRWHISLSTWLRDYLYISLGGNRRGKWMTYRNLMLTMVLGGLWHGDRWTFLVWGALHGGYLALEKALSPTPLGRFVSARVPVWVRSVFVFHLVCLAWIFFRSNTFDQAYFYVRECFECLSHPLLYVQRSQVPMKLWVYTVFLLSFEWLEPKLKLEEIYQNASWPIRFAVMYAAIAVISLCAEMNAKAFIYFQF